MSSENNLTLFGKRAVVTGAGRGIGRSIALALAGAGADVAVTARNISAPTRPANDASLGLLPVQATTLPRLASLSPNERSRLALRAQAGRAEKELEELVAQIQAMGRKSVEVSCDVTDPEQVKQMATTLLGTLGGIDILVNNAGNAGSHKFLNHPDELWHRMLSVNLSSVYYVTKAFVPALIEQRWGRIINIASIASRVGGSYIAAYTAAKHGVLGLTRALAVELLPYNITVNAICPGYVDTPMTDASISNIMSRTGMAESQAREALEKTSPQQRLMEPEEIAAAAVFLAQDTSKGITGQAINIDGGGVMS